MSDDSGSPATTLQMRQIGLKELLQAGVHFGHQTSRWNPKMRRYIFAERGGIYLIDLKKTLRELQRAQELARETVLAGKSALFVCTKPQLAEIVRGEAERCGAFYVTERWLGGMLTNFQTIKKNIRRLKELERGGEEGVFEHYTKKEQLLLERERQKLERYLSGIKDMTRLPGMVYVVDAKKEEIAVREAHRLEIPIVAIADTNADPDMLTVPIAGNDDAIRSVSLITRAIADAIEIARRDIPAEAALEDEEEAYTYSSDVAEAEEEAPRRKRKRRSRPRRRPRPEVIAKRLHQTEEGGEAEAGEAVEEGAETAGEAETVDEAETAGEAETRTAPAGGPTKAGPAKADEMEADPAAETEEGTPEEEVEEAEKPAARAEAKADREPPEPGSGETEAPEAPEAAEDEPDEAEAEEEDEVLASAEAGSGGGPDEERSPE